MILTAFLRIACLLAIFMGSMLASGSLLLSSVRAEDETIEEDQNGSQFLCNIYSIFRGPVGKGLAILTLIGLGVGFFMGKIQNVTSLFVVFGIAAIFGAPSLVSHFTGAISGAPCSTAQQPNYYDL